MTKVKALIVLCSFVVLSILSANDKKVVIDIEKQMGFAIEGDKIVFSGKISSGMKGRETPQGNFVITQKKRYHKSTSWPKPNGGAKMPYMMRLSGLPIAMHLGFLPGYPASHGCIRLQQGFAQKMFKWTKIGTKVKIIGKYKNEVKHNNIKKGEDDTPPKTRMYGQVIDKNYYKDVSEDVISPTEW